MRNNSRLNEILNFNDLDNFIDNRTILKSPTCISSITQDDLLISDLRYGHLCVHKLETDKTSS